MAGDVQAALREAQLAMRGLEGRGRTTRIPRRARRAIVAYVEAARAEGQPWWQISRGVGLSETALRRWREDEGGAAVGLVPVEVVAPERVDGNGSESSRLAVITPGGFRIEGLGLEQIAALLARLGQ